MPIYVYIEHSGQKNVHTLQDVGYSQISKLEVPKKWSCLIAKTVRPSDSSYPYWKTRWQMAVVKPGSYASYLLTTAVARLYVSPVGIFCKERDTQESRKASMIFLTINIGKICKIIHFTLHNTEKLNKINKNWKSCVFPEGRTVREKCCNNNHLCDVRAKAVQFYQMRTNSFWFVGKWYFRFSTGQIYDFL